ncbi:hypothetical protein DOS84_14140 [Flavobacterium aquariorum]|uniref:Uncharacterized protein n=1 Tax=Flavobacterium aquariorum TaxID=2217670 RepID=A0A2W7UBL0_9FLAO|nr:hypothetical protein DOS84_14140 [Flavobacterium aquariorum]
MAGNRKKMPCYTKSGDFMGRGAKTQNKPVENNSVSFFIKLKLLLFVGKECTRVPTIIGTN